MGSTEVVEVWFDPMVLPFADLLAKAEEKDCARGIWTRNDQQLVHAREKVGERAQHFEGTIRLDAEQKYYLLQSPLKQLPLSEAQACRVNATLKKGWKAYLSPWQQSQAQALLEVEKP